MTLVKLENVSKYYKTESGVSVGMQKVSLEFNLGEFVAVTGESGSGKSTLLNVLSGLDVYEDGELYLKGEETSHFLIKDWENYRSKYVGFVFQNYNIIDSFTVYQNVLLALEIQNYPRKLRRARALELIEKVGLLSHKNHRASKLSGGQKQRAVIARALAKDCPIIVADEPTGNLDSESSKQVISLLQEVAKDKLVIIVTHDYEQVKDIATRKIKMHDGEIVEDKQVKPVPIIESVTEPSVKPMTTPAVMGFALRNLRSRPKLLFFFVTFQVTIILMFVMMYSNVMNTVREGLFDIVMPTYQETYFDFNKDMLSDNRMNVVRKDGKDFTNDDFTALENLSDKSHFVYRGVTLLDVLNQSRSFQKIDVNNNDNYLQVLALDSTYHIAFNPQFLEAGSLDNLTNNDIIISNGMNLVVGDKILFTQYKQTKTTQIAFYNEENDNYYFPNLYDYSEWVWVVYFDDGDVENFQNWSDTFVPEYEIDDEARIEQITKVELKLTTYVEEKETLNVVGVYNDNYRGLIYFPHEQLISSAKTNKTASLVAANEITAERLFSAINTSTYRVIYPTNETNQLESILGPINFLVSLMGYAFIFMFASFLYFILYSVMKNVMNSRKSDFAIFRSIGANESKLGLLVIFEQFFMMVVSFVIAFIFIYILGLVNYEMNVTLQQLQVVDYFILFLTFTYLSLWLARRFNKKTFNLSVIQNLTESRENSL